MTALLCLPPAGGRHTAFADWPSRVAEHTVVPVRTPRSRGERPMTMAEHVGAVVLGHAAHVVGGDYVVLGHSVGAHVALHLLHLVADLGLPAPRRLVTIAARPPGHPDPESPLSRLSDARLTERVRAYGGTSAAALDDPEVRAIVLDLVRTDLRLAETAPLPGTPLDVPVSSIGGDRDAAVPAGLLPYWAAVTTAAHDHQVVPGGHFLEDRRALLAALTRTLTTANPAGAPR